MSAPCVLIASCSEIYEPDTLVKQILSSDELPECTVLLEEIRSYPWHVDTKYYTADVLLCTTNTRTIGNEEFAERVEAILIHFDGDNKASFNQVKSWIPFVKEIDPEVKMLVCENSISSHVIPRHVVVDWCLDYGFELVEMTPEQEEVDEETEDDFVDSCGIKRMLQALHAHTWSNLEMKDQPNIRSPYFNQLMKEQAEENAKEGQERLSVDSADEQECDSADGTASRARSQGQNANAEGGKTSPVPAIPESDKHSKEKEKPPNLNKDAILNSMVPPDELAMYESLDDDDEDCENFEKLFSQLNVMADRAKSVPSEERKIYAEKMAISFWRAIGGDEEEISNLSDSSNEQEQS